LTNGTAPPLTSFCVGSVCFCLFLSLFLSFSLSLFHITQSSRSCVVLLFSSMWRTQPAVSLALRPFLTPAEPFLALFSPRFSTIACLVPRHGDLRDISTATPKSGAITAVIAPSAWHGLSGSAVRLANLREYIQLPMWDRQESWVCAARLQR
jgi:hypothetical protein